MLVGISSVAMLVAGEVLARPLSQIFVGYDQGLMNMTLRGLAIYSFSFLFAGIGIFGSAFFTALNNGLVSAIISFLRTLVFQVGAVLILPLFWKLDGIWMSMVAAELLATVVTVLFLISKRKQYHYEESAVSSEGPAAKLLSIFWRVAKSRFLKLLLIF